MRTALRCAAFGLVLAALASCSMFDYSNMVVHKYALVYGVTRYTMSVAEGSGPNLLYPDADATAVYAQLKAQNYIVSSRWVDPSGNVWLNNVNQNQKIGSLVNTSPDNSGSSSIGQGPGDSIAPSKPNIIADINALAPAIGANDVLVVYFSGHGTQDNSVTPYREYFDPYGAVMDDGTGTFYDYPYPSVRDDDLRAALNAIKTPRKVLILDTCNSGGFVGNQLEVDWTPQAVAGQISWVNPATLISAIAAYATMQSSPTGLSPYGTAQVLSAAGRDESSYETSAYVHGVMTYWLLQGLSGPADLNKDGHITVLEAFAYAKAGVDQNWNASNPTNPDGTSAKFEPHVSGGPVDFGLF